MDMRDGSTIPSMFPAMNLRVRSRRPWCEQDIS
jgi:hypothetical protein